MRFLNLKNKTYQGTQQPQSYQEGGSIVDYLKQQGYNADFNTRKQLARKFMITDYKGTAEQNLQLLEALKNNASTPTTRTFKGVSYTDSQGNTVTPTHTVDNPAYVDLTQYKRPAAPVQPTTFKQAFAQAHRDGKQEFEWNGGRYKVAFKNEDPAKDAAAIQKGTTTVEPAALAPQYQTGITWNALSQYAHDAYNAEINNKIALDKQIEGLKAIQYKNNTLYKQKVKELYDNSSAKARNYIRAAGLNPYQDTNYIKAMEGIQVADTKQNATATAAPVPGNYVEKINPVTEHPMMKWYTGS